MILLKRNSRTNKFLNSKICLVTGATSGIGREIAKQMVSFKCKVLVCGRDKEAMGSLLRELNSNSSFSAEGFLADFSNKESLTGLIDKINKNYDLDILINCAGLGYMSDFYLMSEEKICSMQEVNISAIIALCRAFLPRMIEKARGGILNVGSVASFFATPGSCLYGATKHFIAGFTDALHQEMLSFGVHVTGLYPGHTESRFAERATEGKLKCWKKAISAATVASLALQGLSENRIRVVPGLGNKMRVFAGTFLPASIILKKIYSQAVKNY